MRADKKIPRTADFFLLVQFLIIGTLIVWLTKIEVTPLRALQYVMIFWFYIIYLKGYRLTQAISAIDSEVVDNIKSINKEILREYRGWTYHIKKTKKISFPISIILFVFAVVSMIFHMPINIFKDVFLLILFVNIMMYGLIRSIAINEFIGGILELRGRIYLEVKEENKVTFDTNISNRGKITKKFVEGFLIGVIFVVILYYFFKMSIFHYFLYSLAFIILYSLSRILIMIYRYFSNALNLIDNIRLVHTETKTTDEESSCL